MRRKTEMLFLLTILLVVGVQSYSVMYYNNPIGGVTASDYWSHIISMRQMDAEQIINYENSWTNIFRLKGGYKYYPPGFPVILNAAREMAGLGFYEEGYISILLWVLFCLSIYLIARKVTGRGEVGLLAAFAGATFVSGTNMLGPMYPVASNLSVAFILMAMLAIVTLRGNGYRITIASVLLCGMFVSHRASVATWLIMLPMIGVFPLLFVKNRIPFLVNFHVPLIFSTLIGALMSFVFWFNLPMDMIMKIGGILSQRLDVWLFGVELTQPALTGLILLAFVLLLLIYSWPGTLVPPVREVGPLPTKKTSLPTLIGFILILPALIGGLVFLAAMRVGGGPPFSPSAALELWGDISTAAHYDPVANGLKQLLYVWHLNALPLVMLMPASYLLLRAARRNQVLMAAIAAIATIALIFGMSETFEDVKVQRIYFYIAPFTAIVSGWGAYAILRRRERWAKTMVVVCVIGAIAISAYSLPYNTYVTSNPNISSILWDDATNVGDSAVATFGFQTLVGRGFGDMNFAVYYDILRIKEHAKLVRTLRAQGAGGVLIPTEANEYTNFIAGAQAVLIFRHGSSSVWVI